jgi:hypothetical protein
MPSACASAAMARSRAGSFEGSTTCRRRIPLRATSLNASAITSSPAGTQEMNRIPLVIIPRGVFGIAALTNRIRRQGSSRWKRTEMPMKVLAVKSSAW